MTSDYLKQLQLTKQLEQKAKEAAKNRKAAEEKIAEAEKALAVAKGLGADMAEAERYLTEGRTAYEKKDYSVALASALRSLEGLHKLENEKIVQLLDVTEGILSLVKDRDQGGADVEEMVAKSRKLLGEGKYEESLKRAQEARQTAEDRTNQRIGELFTQAQGLIDLAETHGLSVSAKRQLLAKAAKMQEEGDREGAIAKLASCSKGLKDSFTKQLEERGEVLGQMLSEVSELGVDTVSITALLDGSKEKIGGGDIGGALELMSKAEEAITPSLLQSVRVKLAKHDERRDWLIQQGVDVTRYATASRKLTEMLDGGDREGSLEWLRRSAKALRECEAELVLSAIDELRPRLVLAKKLRADLGSVMEKLEEVRGATTYGRIVEALELVNEASAELDDCLAPYRELGKELSRTKAVFMQARRMKIISKEAGDLVARSRKTVLEGSTEEAAEVLQESRAILIRLIQEGCLGSILDSELLVSMGWSIGATVDEEASELDDVVADLRNGEVEDISALLSQANEALRKRISERTSNIVGKAASTVATVSPTLDLTAQGRKAQEASKALEAGDWYRAYTLAQEAIEGAERTRAETLGHLTAQAAALLDISRQLGSESMTLNQKMELAATRSGGAAESIQVINEVIQFARSLIKDELTRSISQLMRSIAASRKNGVKSSGAETLAEESSHALMAGDLEKSFALYQDSVLDLDKTVALHSEVYDLIVTLSRLIGELGPGAETKVSQLLLETKRLFEAGKYDGARISARKCYQEAETVGAAVLAPRKIQEAKDLVPIIFQLSLDGGPLSLELEEAQSDLSSGRAAQALAKAKEVHRKSCEILNTHISKEIAETKLVLKSVGPTEGSGAGSIIEKAQTLVMERRYSDALRAVRFARNEANQLQNLRSTVDRELNKMREAIDEIADLGIEVKEAAEMVHQAERYRGTGRYNIAIEVARKGLHSARQAARDRIVVNLSKAEQDSGIDRLKGFDLVGIQSSVRQMVMERVDQNRYVEASKALELYAEALHKLGVLRDECASSLSKLAEGLVGVPKESVLMQDTSVLLAKAQQAYQDGRFRDCLGLTEECRAAGSSALLAHDYARERLESARTAILQGEGRRHLTPETASLLTAAEKALLEGRYPDMDRAVLNAKRSHQQGALASNHRALAELINLLKLFPAADLDGADLPGEAGALMDLHLGQPGEIRNLAEITGAVRARITEGTKQKLERTTERVERAARQMKYVDMSRAILPVAERSLAEGKLEQTLFLLRDAEMLIGASTPMVHELRNQGRRFNELRKAAAGIGLTEGHYMEKYREALRSKEIGSAINRMNAAIAALEKSLSPFLPVLEARMASSDGGTRLVLNNTGAAPAIDVAVVTVDGSDGKPLAEIIWPGSTIGVPGQELKGQVRVRYRALLSSQPVTEILTISS